MYSGSQSCNRSKNQVPRGLRRLGPCNLSSQRGMGHEAPESNSIQRICAEFDSFEEITFEHIPREENQLDDALATMSSMFKVRWDNEAPMITIYRQDEPSYCNEINAEGTEEKPWFHEVKRYLEAQEYPEGASINDRKFLRRFAAKFFLSNGTLYKRNHD